MKWFLFCNKIWWKLTAWCAEYTVLVLWWCCVHCRATVTSAISPTTTTSMWWTSTTSTSIHMTSEPNVCSDSCLSSSSLSMHSLFKTWFHTCCCSAQCLTKVDCCGNNSATLKVNGYLAISRWHSLWMAVIVKCHLWHHYEFFRHYVISEGRGDTWLQRP